MDCRDSFTHNLAQLARRILCEKGTLDVVGCDRLDVEAAGSYDRILLSPGPGVPSETPGLMGLIAAHSHRVPMLGVCLGHQALAEHFGGRLVNLRRVFHGIASEISILKAVGPLSGLPGSIVGGRYHSWVVEPDSIPSVLEVTAVDGEGRIMAFSHREQDIHGVQFHPESILTPEGPGMLRNFLLGGGSALSPREPAPFDISYPNDPKALPGPSFPLPRQAGAFGG
jgi:anthranilate synthase component 2